MLWVDYAPTFLVELFHCGVATSRRHEKQTRDTGQTRKRENGCTSSDGDDSLARASGCPIRLHHESRPLRCTIQAVPGIEASPRKGASPISLAWEEGRRVERSRRTPDSCIDGGIWLAKKRIILLPWPEGFSLILARRASDGSSSTEEILAARRAKNSNSDLHSCRGNTLELWT